MVKTSMRKKLLIIFVLLFTIPIVVSMLILNKYAAQFSRYSTEMLNIRSMQATGAAVDQLFGNIYDFSLYLSLNKDVRQFLTVSSSELYTKDYNYAAQSVISTMPYSNRYIKAMAVFGMDERSITSGSRILSLSKQERTEVISRNGAPYWNIELNSDGSRHIFLIRMLRLPERLEQKLGIIKIELNLDELERIFSVKNDVSSSPDGAYYIVDSTGRTLYSYPPNPQGATVEALNAVLSSGYTDGTHYVENLDLYGTPYKLSNIPWVIYRTSNNDYSVSITSTLRKTLVTSMMLCFIFCLLLSSIFSASIIAPLRKLGKLMKQIEDGRFDVRFHPRGNDEITVLAKQFDHMSQQLQKLYNEVYLGQLRLKDARLAVLQAQINPHFLYNTLDTIYWMSEFNHTSDVSNMVSALSQLFRLSLSGDENDMVPLESELAHIQCYLYIQQIRHQEDLSFTITNHTDTKLSVLKLILQPLVENAIIHGIDKVGQGVLQILIEQQDNCLIYEVSDSAGLADPDAIQAILNTPRGDLTCEEKRHSIGLRNINDRIQMRCGDGYGISCYLRGGYTVFTVRLPILPLADSELQQNEEVTAEC